MQLSLDVVTAAIEHLAQSHPAGRTNVALLVMERGPVIGYNWPSAVTGDNWLNALTNSAALKANGIQIIELTKAEAMMGALASTNYLAILNPYGELVPATLSGGVPGTVNGIGGFVRAGGTWFEVGGHAFYQALQPVLYYAYNVAYPPAFADFMQLETANGNFSVYGVQPVPADPWAGRTNPATLFVPGQLAWGGDTNASGGYFERAFGTYVAPNQTWRSPVVRLALGHAAADSLNAYCQANQFSRTLTNKLSAANLAKLRQSVLINYQVSGAAPTGIATQLIAHLPQLPTPALVHFAQYLHGGFDKQYPDHLPPNASFGTPADFTNFLGQARTLGLLTMPYSNPTFWGDNPRGPTFSACGDVALVTNLDGTLSAEAYFGNGGYTACPWQTNVEAANLNTLGQFMTNYPVDMLFEDQIGARTWQYDLNSASPTPYAYMAGNTARAAEDSQSLPVSTENGYDRLVNFESQFCGLAWGIAPTINAPDWRRFLTDRYLPTTWQIFPVAQYVAHDKLEMNFNDLNAPVTGDETIAWALGLGYGMSYTLNAADLDQPATRQWLLWIDRLQKSVCAQYVGQPVTAFSHQWGASLLNPGASNGVIQISSQSAADNGVMQANYGPVSVVANLGPNQLATNGYVLAPYGFVAAAPGLFAANVIPSGSVSAVSSVAQTNGAGGLDFWIYSLGGVNATVTLPAGFNGSAIVVMDGGPTNQLQVQNNALTVSLGVSTNKLLWHGTIARATAPPILVDFGNNSSYRGASVVNPDANGNYWNSVWSGAFNADLIDVTGAGSSVGLGFDAAVGTDFFNGPSGAVQNPAACSNVVSALKSNPSGALLAVSEAVYDYYVSSKFQLQGLATNRVYRLTFFGSHVFSDDTATMYSICTDATYNSVVTSTSLNVQSPTAAWQCNSNQVAVIGNLVPQTNGVIYVKFVGSGGINDGYLNCMMLESAVLPAPTNLTARLAAGAVQLNWNWNGSGQTGFVIQRRLSGAGTWTDLATVGAGITGYADATAVLGLTYDYQIAALQAGGSRGFAGAAATITVLNKLAIFGTSVARGQGSSGFANGVCGSQIFDSCGSWSNSWAYWLDATLLTKGYACTNVSLPADNSSNATNRFTGQPGTTTNIYYCQDGGAVTPASPQYVLIAYSLGNDNLSGAADPAACVATFNTNLTTLVAMCRTNGYYPIVSLGYARNSIRDANRTSYFWNENLVVNGWNVPSFNLDGAMDDGNGGLVTGLNFGDGIHPNDYGHREIAYAFVPSLLDAINAGKTNSPQLAAATNFARLTNVGGLTNAPLTHAPADVMHSFTLAFRVRTTTNGTVAAVRSGANFATLRIQNGNFVYVGTNGASQIVAGAVTATNGAWHDVALVSRYALTNTWLYVDGVVAGTNGEQFAPDLFILGGPGASGAPTAPPAADYQNWCVYRSAWNGYEAAAQSAGALQQASLEIGAMLDDAAFAVGSPATNRAQSLSVATVNSPNLVATQGVPAPTALTAQSLSTTSAKLAWSWNGGGQTGFVIQRRATGGAAWSDLATVSALATAFTNASLTPGAAYDYRVAATEAGGLRGYYGNVASVALATSVHQTILIDLGPNDVTNGDATTNQDYLGQSWNNLIAPAGGSGNSLGLANLVTTSNAATPIGLFTGASGWSCNGKLNGGLPTPSYALLGNFAVTNATEDYFYTTTTAALTLTNLDASSNYRLRFFGTRNTDVNTLRITSYKVAGGNGPFVTNLQTSGNNGWTNNGTNYFGNDNKIAAVSGVAPDGNRQIQLTVATNSASAFAYLGVLELTANRAPVAGTVAFARAAGNAITITNADLLANDTDADGDPLTVVGFGALPVGATTNGAVSVTLPGTNAAVSFNYYLTDGFCTVTGVVNVSALNGIVPGHPLAGQFAGNNPNGAFTIGYYGAAGCAYALQRSTNLIDPNAWVNLLTNVFSTDGATNVSDAVPPQPTAYYRIKWLTP